MFGHSKIQVWYQVASQKVVLGEAVNNDCLDVITTWIKAPEAQHCGECQGYRLSLFDDDGREIADKPVSMITADKLLSQ